MAVSYAVVPDRDVEAPLRALLARRHRPGHQGRQERVDYIRECLESLADELYALVIEPNQDVWVPDRDCPWCRLLASRGLSGNTCPICGQVRRSRRSGGPD